MASVASFSNAKVDTHLLLAYIADLELEIDRLRKHGRFVQQQARDTLKRIQAVCTGADQNKQDALQEIGKSATELRTTLRDLQELPGYHPALDQVTAIAVRPLAEQVFRWHQRLESAPHVGLRFELEIDHVDWFPSRLRHILDNLLSNALQYRDPNKAESWVKLQLRERAEGYEFIIADNGVGLSSRDLSELFSLLYRAAPARAAGLGVGLAVVKLLVEQSGGALSANSEVGAGSSITVVLPRYEVDDFLT